VNDSIVMSTLEAALADAAGRLDNGAEELLLQAAALIGDGFERPAPSPHLPEPVASGIKTFVVGSDDTASAMGHPDPLMAVLGSPRLALWFEIVATSLLPPRPPE
jgi:hypothetical protein